MAKTFREWNVNQSLMFPPSVRDFVPEGHLAHFVRDTVVENLDLSEILDAYTEERGFPPYDPAMMTALLLYAYCQGDLCFAAHRQGLRGAGGFHGGHGPAEAGFPDGQRFPQTASGGAEGSVCPGVAVVPGRGTGQARPCGAGWHQSSGQASKHKAMSYGRMKQAEPKLAAEVARWLREAEAVDDREDQSYGEDCRGDELPQWVADKQKRLEKIREAKAALEREAEAEARAKGGYPDDDEGSRPRRGRKPKTPPGTPKDKEQRNFTDPESRIMKTGDGFIQGYNAKAAVDAEHQVIVAQGLSNNASDAQQLVPMLKAIKANTGRQARELSADAGYCSEDNLKALNRHHIRGYVATGRQKHGQSSATGKGKNQTGTRVQAMRARLKQGGFRSRYRLRKQIVEPVFGQIKQARGFRQCLLRGLDKAAGEWSLLCTAHNLLKLAAATG